MPSGFGPRAKSRPIFCDMKAIWDQLARLSAVNHEIGGDATVLGMNIHTQAFILAERHRRGGFHGR